MSDVIIPVFIPHRHEPPKCPSCEKTESIKRVCRHCGHEYAESDGLSFGAAILITCLALLVFGALGGLWFLISDINDWSLPMSLAALAGLIGGVILVAGIVYLLANNRQEWAGKEKRG